MTLHHWNQTQFFHYLESNGCTVIATVYTDYRVYQGPNSEIVPIKLIKAYFHPAILRYCEDLGIESPEEFQKLHEEFNNLRLACEKKAPMVKVMSSQWRYVTCDRCGREFTVSTSNGTKEINCPLCKELTSI